MIPIYAMHRDSEFFGENVEKFEPERFLNGAAKELIDKHIFHAFGGGPRICIGMRFAMAEMKITLAKLFCNFQIIEEPNITKLEFDKGNQFFLSFKDMKVRIQERQELA